MARIKGMTHDQLRERRRLIADLAQTGLDDWMIATALGVSTDTVRMARLAAGVRKQRVPDNARWAGDLPRLKHLVMAGCTLEEIGAEMGYTRENARKVLSKAGMRTRRKADTPQLTRFHSIADEGLRRCYVCREMKALDEFVSCGPVNASQGHKSGKSYRCKSCMAAINRARYHDPQSGFAERQKAYCSKGGPGYEKQLKRTAAWASQQSFTFTCIGCGSEITTTGSTATTARSLYKRRGYNFCSPACGSRNRERSKG